MAWFSRRRRAADSSPDRTPEQVPLTLAVRDSSAVRSPPTEHPGMKTVRIEIGRHDWNAIFCGCGGSASHLPAALLELIAASTPGEATLAGVDDHVMIQSNLMNPAPATTAVILAALADPSLTTPDVRTALLQLLLAFSAGDTIQQEQCEAIIGGGSGSSTANWLPTLRSSPGRTPTRPLEGVFDPC